MNLDPEKLVVLLVIALLVLGPDRLPQVARSLGRWSAEIRKYRSYVQNELRGVLDEPRALIDQVMREAEQAPHSELGPSSHEPAPSSGDLTFSEGDLSSSPTELSPSPADLPASVTSTGAPPPDDPNLN